MKEQDKQKKTYSSIKCEIIMFQTSAECAGLIFATSNISAHTGGSGN